MKESPADNNTLTPEQQEYFKESRKISDESAEKLAEITNTANETKLAATDILHEEADIFNKIFSDAIGKSLLKGERNCFGRISHTILTPLTHALFVLYSLPSESEGCKEQVIRQLDSIQDIIKFSINISQGRVPPLRSSTLDHQQFFDTIRSELESYCDIISSKLSDYYVPIKDSLKETEPLFSVIGKEVKLPSKTLNKKLLWNEQQLKVAIDGIITNSIQHSNRDCHAIKLKLSYITDNSSSGLFLVCKYPGQFPHEEFEKASALAKSMSESNHIDWIGISLLHIANQAFGFERPTWRAYQKKNGPVYFESRIQIAKHER